MTVVLLKMLFLVFSPKIFVRVQHKFSESSTSIRSFLWQKRCGHTLLAQTAAEWKTVLEMCFSERSQNMWMINWYKLSCFHSVSALLNHQKKLIFCQSPKMVCQLCIHLFSSLEYVFCSLDGHALPCCTNTSLSSSLYKSGILFTIAAESLSTKNASSDAV